MWKFLLLVFLTIGSGIAIYSLYNASVTGTMEKMGLVGADFSASVVSEKLDQGILTVKSDFQCGLPTRIKGAMSLLLSSDDKRGELSFRFGQDRIKCGAAIIASGNVETGTYEVLKGLGYLQAGYKFVSERMTIDSRVCRYLPEADMTSTINTLLSATNGRVHELIFDEWSRVVTLREEVDPVCLGHRQKTR